MMAPLRLRELRIDKKTMAFGLTEFEALLNWLEISICRVSCTEVMMTVLMRWRMARGEGLALSFVILKALAEEAEGQQEDQEVCVRKGKRVLSDEGSVQER